MRNFAKKHENLIIAIITAIAMFMVIAACFDFYYQANDDILIKNILSGVYTGTPESRNIQMHYPMSLFISLLYRVARGIPWYGLLLCVAHFFACGYIIYNSCEIIDRKTLKILISVMEAVLFGGTMLYEFVFTQYTVTCGMLSAAALFGIYMSDRTLAPKQFIKANIPNVILIFIAFVARSEMLLLMFPFICVTGFLKWTNIDKTANERMFCKKNVVKYFALFGIIVASLGVGQGIHMIAYSGEEWKAFQEFFDNRTELYDYQFIPSYEGNEEFYDGIGLAREEVALLENYNFGIDTNITSDTLIQVANYAKSLKGEDVSLVSRMKNAIPDYKYILQFGQSSDPYGSNWAELILMAYLFLLLFYIRNKDYGHIWQPFIIFVVRSGLWVYMISTGRYPARITHSLYFIELALIIAIILEKSKKRNKKDWFLPILSCAVLGVLAIGILGANYQKVKAECESRDRANIEYEEVKSYCKSNPENFYFIDVYSFCSSYEDGVEYSEKIFEDVDNSFANYDYLGGWLVGSPHTLKKLDGKDLRSANCFLLLRSDRDTRWLTDYYDDVIVEKEESINQFFGVYKVRR